MADSPSVPPRAELAYRFMHTDDGKDLHCWFDDFGRVLVMHYDGRTQVWVEEFGWLVVDLSVAGLRTVDGSDG